MQKQMTFQQTSQSTMSDFQKIRQVYQPILPELLAHPDLTFESTPIDCLPEIKAIFPTLSSQKLEVRNLVPAKVSKDLKEKTPLRVGLVLSGGQAPGGHNVISGIFDFIKNHNKNSQLFGFLDGPRGIFTQQYVEINDEFMDVYRNQGGFDMICSGRDKIEKEDEFLKSMEICQHLDLHGLVVIGGDDSNTNACVLAEYFKKHNCKTNVIGCPKTIDGDLKNEHIDISFGFDTACKVYSELIGNISLDCVSSKKYHHFIRLMGRSASHIALECAYQTRPTETLIGEEVQLKNISLEQQVESLAKTICARSQKGKDYGVYLVPEGLIEFFPDVSKLIKQINEIFGTAKKNNVEIQPAEARSHVLKSLQEQEAKVFNFLPESIQDQLLLDRDPHGNVQVAKIDTEKLLVLLLEVRLEQLKQSGQYKGSFSPQTHYFGYEGRCALPSNFDSNYCYALGQTAGALINMNFTGYMSTLKYLKKHPKEWVPAGVPLLSMMNVERRLGKDKPVIKKALVELDSHIFKVFEHYRQHWALNDCFRSPGPIQYEGELANEPTFLIKLLSIEDLKSSTDDPNAIQYAQRHQENMSELEMIRTHYKAHIPEVLEVNNFKPKIGQQCIVDDFELRSQVKDQFKMYYENIDQHQYIEFVGKQSYESNHEAERKLVAKQHVKIGIVFNGRQAPGGNNVIDGLLRFADANNGEVYGFIGGTQGLFEQKYIKVTRDNFKLYNNQGGFDFLGRTADKLRTPEELEKTKQVCENLKLTGLILVGATHTLTDATILTDYFIQHNVSTSVIGVPATVDGNIHHPLLEAIIGFDTASKIYSQLIGNIMTDAASAKKYWYFMRLMGRDPSILVLETALQTHPNCVIISEKCREQGENLQDVVNYISDIICERAAQNKQFGTVLIPEGLLNHLTHIKLLIDEINKVFKEAKTKQEQQDLGKKLFNDNTFLKTKLPDWSSAIFLSLPEFTRKQLLFERETSGGIQLSQIETERLLSYLVKKELAARKKKGTYKGSFSPVEHFFGYQGRCGTPSIFDCNLASTYGYTAGALIQYGFTGYCVSARCVLNNPKDWIPAGIPLLSMVSLSPKSQYGLNKAIVPSSEVDLHGKVYEELKVQQKLWIHKDHYSNPGSIQFQGYNYINKTTVINNKDYLGLLKQVTELCENINNICHFGVQDEVLKIAVNNLQALQSTLTLLKKGMKIRK